MLKTIIDLRHQNKQFELKFTALVGIETLVCLAIIVTNMIFLIAILK